MTEAKPVWPQPPIPSTLCANCPHYEQYHTSGVIEGTTRGCTQCAECPGFEPAKQEPPKTVISNGIITSISDKVTLYQHGPDCYSDQPPYRPAAQPEPEGERPPKPSLMCLNCSHPAMAHQQFADGSIQCVVKMQDSSGELHCCPCSTFAQPSEPEGERQEVRCPVRDSLRRLSNEAAGMLGYGGQALRDVVGNTNFSVLEAKINDARVVLKMTEPSSPSTDTERESLKQRSVDEIEQHIKTWTHRHCSIAIYQLEAEITQLKAKLAEAERKGLERAADFIEGFGCTMEIIPEETKHDYLLRFIAKQVEAIRALKGENNG